MATRLPTTKTVECRYCGKPCYARGIASHERFCPNGLQNREIASDADVDPRPTFNDTASDTLDSPFIDDQLFHQLDEGNQEKIDTVASDGEDDTPSLEFNETNSAGKYGLCMDFKTF